MFVYQIVKKEHSALDGMGGMYGPGRWHEKGNLVIYTSEHASIAAWEKIVHLGSFENLPNNLLLIKINIPDEYNIILNPLHPEIQACKVISATCFIFDIRVLKDHS